MVKFIHFKRTVVFVGCLILSLVSLCSYGQELELVREKGWGEWWGYVDKLSGKVVIPYQYEYAKDFSEGLAAVRQLHRGWGFIDKTGKVVIPFGFQQVKSFSEGLAAVKFDRKWGFIDKSGNSVVPIVYKDVNDFSDGYAVVRNGRFLGAVDKNGTMVVPCIYNDIYSVNAAVAKERAAEETAQQQEVTNSSSTNAPDIILLKNGSEIKAKVDEITLSEIKYKQFDYLDGPTRTVAKNDVFAIIYENGTREVISATSGTNTRNTTNASNRAGEVAIGFSPVIYVEEDLFMFGFCGKLRVSVANPIRLEGSFTYHLPKTIELDDEDVKINMWDVNLDMQAIVTKSDKFLLYPLIGLRVWGMKVSVEGKSGSETFFGLNSGFGFDVKLSDKVFFNLESKYKLSFVEKETVSGFTASMGLIIKF